MGYEDDMQDYYDEIKNKISYYTLIVPTGTYTSDNICLLLWELFTHRLWHLWNHRRWMD